MDFSRRLFLGSAACAAGAVGFCCTAQTPGSVFRPEDFGARGDGRTNDSGAFAALAAAVSASGGGRVEFRPTTYLVGTQRRVASQVMAFAPSSLLEFRDCTKPLILRGNGARIRCVDRLRFGTFNPRSGEATRHAMPFYDRTEIASPYSWMIFVANCRNTVEISDFELDGNLPRLLLGGPWGDVGHQIAAGGIRLVDNSGPELLRNLHLHHHGQDGLMIDGIDRDRGVRSRIETVRSEYNARQGCSVIGGRGYDFLSCHFNHTGRGGLASPPGAGVDVEAENNKKVRDITFTACEFADNHGAGCVADSGDSAGVSFNDCVFVGTTTWALWPHKPQMRFNRCRIIGPTAHAFGDGAVPERATQFHDCAFLDDPALSPTRRVYGTDQPLPIVNLPGNPSVLFARCRFDLRHGAELPWTVDCIYSDCTMGQSTGTVSYPRGSYRGRNTIRGNAILAGSTNNGELFLNGTRLPRGRIG